MTKTLQLLFVIVTCALAFLAGSRYVGHLWVFILFTLLGNALLVIGIGRRALFFDTFIGVFFWLGFWLKLALRVAFTHGRFHEPVGAFNGSGAAFDHALIVSSCGFAAILVANLIRRRFFQYPETVPVRRESGLYLCYRAYRGWIVAGFLMLVLLVAVSNAWLGIYQRGMVPQTILPLGLSGVYKWLLLFGLASFSAQIIRYEIELNQGLTLLAIFVPLTECFFSNVSLLSRGMVLNASALGFGGLHLLARFKKRVAAHKLAIAAGAFAVLFVTSVVAVNVLRAEAETSGKSLSQFLHGLVHPGHLNSSAGVPVANAVNMTTPLFIDRWVGMEGVMAVSASNKLGWPLWKEALREKYHVGELSLYDRELIDSPYKDSADSQLKYHFVSLPGLIAFLYYPGSLPLLFGAMLLCALMAAALEIATYRWCGQNLILCSLFAEVIAYRYTCFGYEPAQTYLLFGALILNGLLFLAADRLFARLLAGRATMN